MTMSRPRWASHARWLVEGQLLDMIIEDPEKMEYNPSRDDPILDELEARMAAYLCEVYGHDIEDDQCGIPEHRYCVGCGLRETTINDQV